MGYLRIISSKLSSAVASVPIMIPRILGFGAIYLEPACGLDASQLSGGERSSGYQEGFARVDIEEGMSTGGKDTNESAEYILYIL